MSKLYAMTDHLSSPSSVRVGDRERTEAAERLSAHAAEGRLGIDELEQRLERANAAVFARDLAALETDLPGPGRSRPWRRARPPLAVLAGLLAAALLAAALLITVVVGHPIVPLFLVALLLWRRAVHLAPMRSLR